MEHHLKVWLFASPRQERAQTDVGRLARLQVDRLLGQLAQMSELRAAGLEPCLRKLRSLATRS